MPYGTTFPPQIDETKYLHKSGNLVESADGAKTFLNPLVVSGPVNSNALKSYNTTNYCTFSHQMNDVGAYLWTEDAFPITVGVNGTFFWQWFVSGQVTCGTQTLGTAGAQFEVRSKDPSTPIQAGYTSTNVAGYVFTPDGRLIVGSTIDQNMGIMSCHSTSPSIALYHLGQPYINYWQEDGGYCFFTNNQTVWHRAPNYRFSNVDTSHTWMAINTDGRIQVGDNNMSPGLAGAKLEVYSPDNVTPIFAGYTSIGGAAATIDPTGIISSAVEFRLVNNYSRVATSDGGGGWGGGYNFDVNGGAPRYDSTGNISGIWFNGGGGIGFYTGASQPAHTAATMTMALSQTSGLIVSQGAQFGGNVTCMVDLHFGRTDTSPAITVDDVTKPLRFVTGPGTTSTISVDGVMNAPGGFRTDGYTQTVSLAVGTSYHNNSPPVNGAIFEGQVILGALVSGTANGQLEVQAKDTSTPIFAGYTSTGQVWLTIDPRISKINGVLMSDGAGNNDFGGFLVDTGNFYRVGLIKSPGESGILMAGSATPIQIGHRTDSDNLTDTWTGFPGTGIPKKIDLKIDPNGTVTIGTGTGTAGTQGLLVNYGANSTITSQGSANPAVMALSTDQNITTKIQSISSILAGVVGTQSNHALWLETNNTARVRIDADGTVTILTELVLPQSAESAIPNGGAAWSTDNPGHLMARKPDGTLKEIQLL